MNKKNIIVVGIVAIAVISSYIFINQRIFNEKQEAVDISDWKSYTNPVTRYQLKYPPYWDAKEKWKTRAAGDESLYSQEGVTVSFKDTSGEHPSSLTILSSPVIAHGFSCWNFSDKEKIVVGGFDATKNIYTPIKEKTSGIDCTESTISSSMRLVRVVFKDPDSLFPEFEKGISYDLSFIVDESNLKLVDTITSTILLE